MKEGKGQKMAAFQPTTHRYRRFTSRGTSLLVCVRYCHNRPFLPRPMSGRCPNPRQCSSFVSSSWYLDDALLFKKDPIQACRHTPEVSNKQFFIGGLRKSSLTTSSPADPPMMRCALQAILLRDTPSRDTHSTPRVDTHNILRVDTLKGRPLPPTMPRPSRSQCTHSNSLAPARAAWRPGETHSQRLVYHWDCLS